MSPGQAGSKSQRQTRAPAPLRVLVLRWTSCVMRGWRLLLIFKGSEGQAGLNADTSSLDGWLGVPQGRSSGVIETGESLHESRIVDVG